MLVLIELLEQAEQTPEESHDTMKFRDLMYELSVKVESVSLTIPVSLLNDTEKDVISRAKRMVDRYYTNATAVGVAV